MNYLDICTGLSAATVAWHSIGWKPVAFSEIEKFPSLVLAHHYPKVPNLGDMTKFKEWNLGTIDLLVGGGKVLPNALREALVSVSTQKQTIL